ncbi:MAG TPA: hypothetical protein DCL80_14835 [Balneola sp.]|jgi:hypothetical protein|nr:hypothetical protein [Balneola sp.]MAO77348.1 hypothetical protein [Balneola sp.]MBF65306.1 hypothetical protein [Balneola sp.]HAH52451.1 hypothetical protein [Balneola sp.]HBZ38673.1 hypothetical protein [Balneola sp.]|tara:strand:- start:6859 stop:7938 length:1080 start_codon:yes stop_codon:yes gene_type:complete
MNMKLSIYIIVLLALISSPVLSQVTISGSVFDATTKEPLQGVNVYLSETTIGKQTNADGSFSFQTNLTGPFILVASSIGYQTERININIEKGENKSYSFSLKEKPIELDEIVVAADNTEWKSNFNRFQRFFIGDRKFSENTFFQNPEVLRFEGPNKQNKINVYTEAPLIIHNRDLGYIIETEFLQVHFNPDDNTGIYKLNTRFSEMESSDKNVIRRWNKNRSEAYKGSPAHFFKSLVLDDLRKERFKIVSMGSKIERVEESEISQLAFYYPKIWKTLIERYSVFKLTYTPVIVGHQVRFDLFDKVVNDHALSYLTYSGEIPYILIDENGALFDPTVLQLSGKWGFERISVMLPIDYKND